MFTHMLAAIRADAARFLSDTEGAVLPIFAIALVPLVAFIGSAVDYSRANKLRTGLQLALDAAVLAGARDGTSNWDNVALNVFNTNIAAKDLSSLKNVTPTFVKSDNGTYSGSVGASAHTSFMGAVGISSISLAVNSAAVANGATPGQFCVLALNPNVQTALQLNGNATIEITAPQCTLQVNSNSTQAVSLNGNTSITSAHNCFVGSTVKVGNSVVTPAPDAMCKPVPDPFAKYVKPTVGPCNYTNYSASGQKTIALQPGVYCGGMQFSGQVEVTFAPGLYIIKDGVLQANGGTSFTGNGVTFFLTGAGASAELTGQANWHLVAPTTGAFPGFVFFLDPSGPSGLAASASKLAGTAEMYFEGVVYFAKQELTLTGGSQAYTPSPYTAYVADVITINGNGKLVINSDPTKTSVPVPRNLQVSWDGKPHLIR